MTTGSSWQKFQIESPSAATLATMVSERRVMMTGWKPKEVHFCLKADLVAGSFGDFWLGSVICLIFCDMLAPYKIKR